MSKTFARLQYHPAPYMSNELIDFLLHGGFLDPYREYSSFLYVEPETVNDIKQRLREANKKELVEEFDAWINQVKPFTEEGFDFVIMW